jgi:hypothetical protein
VYDTLELIGECLVPCLLPADVWDGSGIGWDREGQLQEYRTLCEAGGLDNVRAAAARVQAEPFEYFSPHESDLTEQLVLARKMFEGRPPWMRSFTGDPITRARELQATAQRHRAEHPDSAWAEFAETVCRELCKQFPSSRELAQERKLINQHTPQYEDGEAPLSGGLWVHSGSEPEGVNAEEFFEGLSANGEYPVMRLDIGDLASAKLWRILEHRAQGLGWLLRAGAVNEQSQESKTP